MTDCIFCKITAGDIPSRQVYADNHAVAFLDLAPFQRGHTLVIPRRHVTNVLDADGALTAIAPAVEQVASLLTERLNAEGLNVFSSAGAVAGQEVFHLHVHLVPRYGDNPGLRGLFSAKHESSADELDDVLAEITGESIMTGTVWRRGLVELGLPFLVALIILPFVISGGHPWPWNPATIDLQVYVYAVHDLLAGKDIFATVTPVWHLYFIYPPIAAILMIPLAIGPYWMWQLIWTAALIWAQQSVLKRCGVPRGWKLALVGIAVVLAVEPLRTTLGYGQVNTLLMAFVVMDLLPDPDGRPDAPGAGRRRLPRGILIGLAASIKLTPALFVIFLLLLGKRRAAVWGIASFVFFTGIGAIFQPHQTVDFARSLLGGNTHTASPLYVGNQSLLGVFYRLLGKGTSTALIGLAIAGVLALIAVIVAASWWRRGAKVFAVALCGLATCLASPLSWTHHYVWILPMGAAVLAQISRVRWPDSPDVITADDRSRLPVWVTLGCAVWVLWVSVCLPLAILPYGQNKELGYSAWQELVGNFGPVLGAVIIVGLAIGLIREARSAAPPRPEPVEGHSVVQS